MSSLFDDDDEDVVPQIPQDVIVANPSSPQFLGEVTRQRADVALQFDATVSEVVNLGDKLLGVVDQLDNVMRFNPGDLDEKSKDTWEGLYKISDDSYKAIVKFKRNASAVSSLTLDTALSMVSCLGAIKGMDDSASKEIVRAQMKKLAKRYEDLLSKCEEMELVSDGHMEAVGKAVKQIVGAEAAKFMEKREGDLKKLTGLQGEKRKKEMEIAKINSEILELNTLMTFMQSKLENKVEAVREAKEREKDLRRTLEVSRGKVDSFNSETTVTKTIQRHVWFVSWDEKVEVKETDPHAKEKLQIIKAGLKVREEALTNELKQKGQVENLVDGLMRDYAFLKKRFSEKNEELRLARNEFNLWINDIYNPEFERLMRSIEDETKKMENAVDKTKLHVSQLVDFAENLQAAKRSVGHGAGQVNALKEVLTAYGSIYNPFVMALEFANSAKAIEFKLIECISAINQSRSLMTLKTQVNQTLPEISRPEVKEY